MGIDFSKENRIARVGLNVPETKNALSPAMLMDLCKIWDECQEDDHIRAVIVHSALPDIFCAGMDLKQSIPLLTGERIPADEQERFLFSAEDGFYGFSKALLKVKELDRPVIAAINGWCITGGFEMAMGCELRIATEDAKFQMRETRLGMMPMSGSNIFLPLQLGSARALEILLTGNVFNARTMLDWGFLNKVVAGKEQLMDEAMSLAERIAGNGPKSVRGMVRLHRQIPGLTLNEAFSREIEIALPVFRSGEPAKGIKAQNEKTKPDF